MNGRIDSAWAHHHRHRRDRYLCWQCRGGVLRHHWHGSYQHERRPGKTASQRQFKAWNQCEDRGRQPDLSRFSCYRSLRRQYRYHRREPAEQREIQSRSVHRNEDQADQPSGGRCSRDRLVEGGYLW